MGLKDLTLNPIWTIQKVFCGSLGTLRTCLALANHALGVENANFVHGPFKLDIYFFLFQNFFWYLRDDSCKDLNAGLFKNLNGPKVGSCPMVYFSKP